MALTSSQDNALKALRNLDVTVLALNSAVQQCNVLFNAGDSFLKNLQQSDLDSSGNWQGLQLATLNNVANAVGQLNAAIAGQLESMSIFGTFGG